MVADVFEVIGDAVSGMVATLTSGITGITSLIYDSTAGNFTFLGSMLLIAVGVALVYWIFRLIRGVTSGVAR